MVEQKELMVYSDRSEKTITVKDKNEVKKILDSRKKQTFLLKGVIGLEMTVRDLIINFDVIETDDHLIKKNSYATAKSFFISQYVFRHLSEFLGIPSAVYDLCQSFRRYSPDDRITSLEHLAEILRIAFNHRLYEVENGRKKDIFLTVFTDIFGSFPRVIHSGIYYPYPDGDAFDKLEKV